MSIHKFIRYWLPPILWMLVIFLMSSRSRVSVTQGFLTDYIIFKSLHIIEYALLNVLLFRAFYFENHNISTSLKWSILFSIAYAFSDEFHQTGIPTRNGTTVDVFIDSIGIVGVSLIIKYKFLIKNKLKK